MEKFQKKYKELVSKVEDFLVDKNRNDSNILRRKFYSDVELFKLDLEEASLEHAEISEKLHDLSTKLRLIPIQRPKKWYDFLETALRFLGVSTSFVFFGTFFSLPILFIRMVDLMTNQDPFHYFSEYLKMFIIWSFLFQSGIDVKVDGLKKEYFNKHSCVVMSFTHASNLDGFFVAGTCPIRQLAFGKKELFVVPFFSWLSLAIGGVPVDRGNRERAIGALRRSVESAKVAKVAIAIAPEGTRSTSGQLLPYKKGAFHIWEELRAPIIPFVIYGAFDLYPVGSWVNQTGKVTVRYLPPIVAETTITRDEMLRKVIICRFLFFSLFISFLFNSFTFLSRSCEDKLWWPLPIVPMTLVKIFPPGFGFSAVYPMFSW
jgi:1-acyl-sn-glycerol-3-phosphate acyltransferase